jgi:hypothetical protein
VLGFAQQPQVLELAAESRPAHAVLDPEPDRLLSRFAAQRAPSLGKRAARKQEMHSESVDAALHLASDIGDRQVGGVLVREDVVTDLVGQGEPAAARFGVAFDHGHTRIADRHIGAIGAIATAIPERKRRAEHAKPFGDLPSPRRAPYPPAPQRAHVPPPVRLLAGPAVAQAADRWPQD